MNGNLRGKPILAAGDRIIPADVACVGNAALLHATPAGPAESAVERIARGVVRPGVRIVPGR